MENYYTGDRIVISIAGNVKDEMLTKLTETFSRVKPTTVSQTMSTPTFLPQTVVRKKEVEQAHLCLGYPGLAVSDPKLYALALFNNTLGGSMSSRLFQEIREKKAYAIQYFPIIPHTWIAA